MLDDDRPGPLDKAFQRHLKDVAPAIRADAQDWLVQLIEGTSRTRPRSRATAAEYLSYHLSRLFKGHGISLDRMRSDRWLEEALSRGPDPLHLSVVFGISSNTAMRYARAARSILEGDRSCP